jgi:hypothetical protein
VVFVGIFNKQLLISLSVKACEEPWTTMDMGGDSYLNIKHI